MFSQCKSKINATLLTLSSLVFAISSTGMADDAFEMNARLGRGVNMGNMLDAPREGEWGAVLKDEYLEACAAAGFDTVRIPVKWSGHAAMAAPYTIDPAFFERVDHVVETALEHGLNVILNMHHYDEIHQQPQAERDRLIGLWTQIAEHYQHLPENVYFEPLNEPSQELTSEIWNEMFPEVLAVVRATNPERMVIVGPSDWNGVHALSELELPEDDRRIIVTFHYYSPFPFTHQGASWVAPSPPLGVEWNGTESERAEVTDQFDQAAAWAEEHERPLLLGEFGAITNANPESRARWTRYIREQAEEHGFSWAYWQFTSNFGTYDADSDTWDVAMRESLLER